MSTPIVIQGTAVPNPNEHKVSTPTNVNSYEYQQGGVNALQQSDKQETSCNDPLFAVLFYGCVAAIFACAAIYAPAAFESVDTSTSSSSYDYTGYFILSAVLVAFSFGGAALGMAVMMCIPEFLIKLSLIFVVVLSGVVAIFSLLSGNLFGGILGLLFFAMGVCYARAVWSRIPFATINLVTAITAIKKHCTIIVFAYFFAILSGLWMIVWALAFFGLFNETYQCDDVTNVCSSPSYGILFGLFLALFFGQQVFQNSIHVCVAGTVGSWWFEPDDASVGCCDTNVFNSFIRTMTTSFGSICFGSLLVAILEALKALAQAARENGDAAFLACLAECILGCLASLLEYFNRWAFIYVGLYGMPYIKAGKSVMELFQSRGWDAIIADDLVGNTLFLVAVVVGLLMAGISIIFEVSTDLLEDAGGQTKLIAGFLGFLIGYLLTAILMSTIGSAVNAVVVLFADAPNEFQQNHPELSQRMREIWNQVYPGSLQGNY